MNRSTVLQVAQDAYQHALVSIDPSRIARIPWKRGTSMQIDMPWIQPEHPHVFLQCLIVMGALNYRFWHPAEGAAAVRRYVRGEKTGARALWQAFEEHWVEDAEGFRQRLSMLDVPGVFGDIPDVMSRRALLEEVLGGQALEEVASLICQEVIATGAVTVEQAHLLGSRFPTAFGDPYLKKAQLLLSMYAAQLFNLGLEVDCSDLTGFSDYQVPRVLHALGITHYCYELQEAIYLQHPVEKGGVMEGAIRSATILACEAIAEQSGCSPADVDNMLWHSQSLADGHNFHLTYTTHY